VDSISSWCPAAGSLGQVPLVLDHHRSTETAVQDAIATGKMDKCLAAINALQAVPLAINVPVLEFMMRSGGDDQSQLRDLTTAEFLACYGQFYIPLQMDFRGRLYGLSHFNFAREDHVRALTHPLNSKIAVVQSANRLWEQLEGSLVPRRNGFRRCCVGAILFRSDP
jgi:DNA-directed RNA polymerase